MSPSVPDREPERAASAGEAGAAPGSDGRELGDGSTPPSEPTPNGPRGLDDFPSQAPPARVGRLDQTGLEAVLGALIHGPALDAEVPLPNANGIPEVFGGANPSDRFSTLWASYHVDATELGLLDQVARDVAFRYVDSADRSACGDVALDDETCQEVLVAEAGRRLLRHPLKPAELADAMVVADATVPSEVRLARRVAALILLPETLFRTELGQPDGALHGHELASALSFSVTAGPPDAELYAQTDTGALDTPDGYAREVERLLASPHHNRRVERFVKEFFRYGDAVHVAKDETPQEVFAPGEPGAADARYAPELLIDDTDRLVAHLVENQRNSRFLEVLLTTDKVVARADTAVFYNLDPAEVDDAPRVQSAPVGQRHGLLGQPSWLVAFSEPDHTNPIRRGLFVQESLLCGHVPPLPIGQEIPPLDYKDKTMRAALAEHSQPGTTCEGCHRFMDPMGLPFEQYDHFGRHREQERGAPVDTTGAIHPSSNVQDLVAPVSGPLELASRLAAAGHVTRCFTAHALEFWFGRKQRPGDARAIEAAARAYEASGGSFDALLTSLLTSDVFIMRAIP